MLRREALARHWGFSSPEKFAFIEGRWRKRQENSPACPSHCTKMSPSPEQTVESSEKDTIIFPSLLGQRHSLHWAPVARSRLENEVRFEQQGNGVGVGGEGGNLGGRYGRVCKEGGRYGGPGGGGVECVWRAKGVKQELCVAS